MTRVDHEVLVLGKIDFSFHSDQYARIDWRTVFRGMVTDLAYFGRKLIICWKVNIEALMSARRVSIEDESEWSTSTDRFIPNTTLYE